MPNNTIVVHNLKGQVHASGWFRRASGAVEELVKGPVGTTAL